jgi:hypothetical protein
MSSVAMGFVLLAVPAIAPASWAAVTSPAGPCGPWGLVDPSAPLLRRLSREELKQLEQTVHEALIRQPIVETPEMLEQRRKLLDEFLAGDERLELAAFEENQARDREKNEQLFARWRD